MPSGTLEAVTLEHVSDLAGNLNLQEQRKLIYLLNLKRGLNDNEQGKSRVDALIQHFRDISIPSDGIDSAEAIRLIRDERMADICESSV